MKIFLCQNSIFFPRPSYKDKDTNDYLVEVEDNIHVSVRFFLKDKQFPTILFFHGNAELSSEYDELHCAVCWCVDRSCWNVDISEIEIAENDCAESGGNWTVAPDGDEFYCDFGEDGSGSERMVSVINCLRTYSVFDFDISTEL